MPLTASTMFELGTEAPGFALPDVDGKLVCLGDFSDASALLVVFMCNHCPFVKHIAHELSRLSREYQQRGAAIVCINSNDVENFPDDAPEKMAEEVKSRGYTFPYLYDETQEVAKAYHAACTPDFYVFDSKQRLVYRGQMDDSRPNTDIPVTGADLRAALDDVLDGRAVTVEQRPSLGCNIKWKSDNEPEYFNS